MSHEKIEPKIEPIWRVKVRRVKSGLGIEEKLIRIPREVSDYFKEFALIRIHEGRLFVEPLDDFGTPNRGEK